MAFRATVAYGVKDAPEPGTLASCLNRSSTVASAGPSAGFFTPAISASSVPPANREGSPSACSTFIPRIIFASCPSWSFVFSLSKILWMTLAISSSNRSAPCSSHSSSPCFSSLWTRALSFVVSRFECSVRKSSLSFSVRSRSYIRFTGGSPSQWIQHAFATFAMAYRYLCWLAETPRRRYVVSAYVLTGGPGPFGMQDHVVDHQDHSHYFFGCHVRRA
ncbi:hypothetical protein BU23DRAFT_257654 [Bimuria novae-zelandiae CBS 107.79]|uniref:Uncharacterized protein n=1 Tax=Bimuria novae-zelandiae CBS 107.79 TaxID=1447943 RepID=A0A6A5UUP7_9PLEO|nr:hypothetical protein BU23DRAFT_257654 [Bimuria novae-zelandiae CBS 107.79]